MNLRIEPRLVASRRMMIAVTILSILAAVPIIAAIFLVYGVDPIQAFSRIFYGAFGNIYSFSETLTKSIPLMLCAVGLSIAFKTVFYNIGAEGQLLLGAIFGTGVALTFPEWPAYILLPLMFTSGMIGGALWGLMPALLKLKFSTNEVISTLMMNYIALKVLEYLVYGPWRGKEVWGFPYTDIFSASAHLPTLGSTRIHYPTLMISLAAAFILYVFISMTKHGFELRVVGNNPQAAKYLGISSAKVFIIVMLVSGGLAGIAGVGEVAGIHHRLRVGISPGYGYTAIIVAWLSQLHPLSTIFTSILFGGLLVGGEMIQISLGLPLGTIQIFNGAFLFSILSGEFFLKNRISIIGKNSRGK